MTITEFLEARIAEDEETAMRADSGRWLPEDKGISFEFYGDEFPDSEAQARLVADTKANQNHIAQWDPARVLAECAAKRAIIALADDVEYMDGRITSEWGGPNDGTADDILKALAAVYKDHPDYRQEWAL